MNTIWWLGVKIETSIPKNLMINMLNKIQNNHDFIKWISEEIVRQNKNA